MRACPAIPRCGAFGYWIPSSPMPRSALRSRTVASQSARIKPYSARASTAYWLQVGVNRHDGSRNGETMCRYSWITKTSPRTGACRRQRARPGRHRAFLDSVALRRRNRRSCCSSRAEMAWRLLGNARITTRSRRRVGEHVARHMAQPPGDPMSLHRLADRFPDDQPDLRTGHLVGFSPARVHDDVGLRGPHPVFDRRAELRSTASSGTAPEAPS